MDKKLHLLSGQLFLTTRATLQFEPDSMLARMFSGELVPGTKDENGAFMIDRSPKYFEPILNYLRTGELNIDPNVNKENVIAEAKYFGIRSLVDKFEENVEENAKDFNGNTIILEFSSLDMEYDKIDEIYVAKYFGFFGKISSVILRDIRKNNLRSFFEIVFCKKEDAMKAIKRCRSRSYENHGKFFFKDKECQVFQLSEWLEKKGMVHYEVAMSSRLIANSGGF